MEYLQPSELDVKKFSFHKFDFEDGYLEYADDDKKFLKVANLKYDGNPYKISLQGELSSNGIISSKFGDTEQQSISLDLDDTEDLSALEALPGVLNHLIEKKDLVRDWETYQLVKRDTLYLKLKHDGKKYKFNTNSKNMDPSNPQGSSLKKFTRVEVLCDLVAYFNYREKKMGLSLTVSELKEPKKKSNGKKN